MLPLTRFYNDDSRVSCNHEEMGTVAKLFLVGLISSPYRLNANSVATMADSAVNPILFLVICVMYWIREKQFGSAQNSASGWLAFSNFTMLISYYVSHGV